jgi:hypothetical protein
MFFHNAPGNCFLTFPNIQKEIIQCCAIETRKKIIEQLGDDHYAILADEASDVSHRQQLVVCSRYVDKLGRPCEYFLGVVHVRDTTFFTNLRFTCWSSIDFNSNSWPRL